MNNPVNCPKNILIQLFYCLINYKKWKAANALGRAAVYYWQEKEDNSSNDGNIFLELREEQRKLYREIYKKWN